MEQSGERLSWSVERRLEFLEFRLFWEGRVNRGDLVQYFGISIPQASADLARYQEIAGNNLRYDRRAKTYVAETGFEPRLLNPSARQYFAQLRLLAGGILNLDETLLGWKPPFAVVPTIPRELDTSKLRDILTAIQTQSAIQMEYQSFDRPAPIWRWITPHALVFDEHRWHVRAWCHLREEFRDFLLARMLNLGDRRPDNLDPATDLEWQFEIKVRIGPHPDMDEAHRRVIELDYGMEQGTVEIPMRLCLAYYLERSLRLDLPEGSSRPERQQIVCLNKDEIATMRQTAHTASTQLARERRARPGEYPALGPGRVHSDGRGSSTPATLPG